MRFWLPDDYKQSRISRTPYPPIVGGHAAIGVKIQTPHHKL